MLLLELLVGRFVSQLFDGVMHASLCLHKKTDCWLATGSNQLANFGLKIEEKGNRWSSFSTVSTN